MESNQKDLTLEINEKPVKDHKKQTFWQILAPLAITVILFILISVTASISSSTNYDLSLHWANVSAILLLIPILLASLIFLVVLAGLVYGLAKLLSIIPPYFGQAVLFFSQASEIVLKGANKIVAPVLSVRVQSSKFNVIKSALLSSSKNKTDNQITM